MEAKTLLETVSKSVEVRVLRSREKIEELRPQWETWHGNRDSDLDFYLSVLSECQHSMRPHVIAVYRDGSPDAILVGRLDATRLDRVRVGYIPVRPRVTALYFVYGALRGNASSENCELIIQEVCNSLSRGEADLAYLNFLKEDSEFYRLAKLLPRALSRDRIRASQRHYTATLPENIELLHKRLSPKVRKNQRWNKMNKDHPEAIKVKCFQAPSEVDELAEVTEQIAKHSYQRGLGVGFTNTKQERDRLFLKAEKGWLRGYVLYIGNQPAAFWIGDINDEVFGSDYLGFDPAFSKYSPGTYLILKVMEGFCGSSVNVTRADFATGHAEYKEAFSDSVWEENEVYIFAPSLRGITLNLVKTSATGINRTLKAILDRAGFLQKIKKGWRDHLIKRQPAA